MIRKNLFYKPTAKFAYLLGFLWGDGYIVGKTTNNIACQIKKEDAEILHDLFVSLGFDRFKDRPSSIKRDKPDGKLISRKAQRIYDICDHTFANFLKKLDYTTKTISPQKVIDWLPERLRKYWLHGYFDADGCFYHKKLCAQMSICSNYDYDWSSVEVLIKNIGLGYSIKKRHYGKNTFSVLRICGKDNIIKFGNYIYDGKIRGLERKFEIYSGIKALPVKHLRIQKRGIGRYS